MLRALISVCLLGIMSLLPGQVDKQIILRSVPMGALVTNISGKADFIGNTPLVHTFNFHSEVSVLRIKLSACGYYDTILKLATTRDSLNILMEQKKFLILPETDKDVLTESEHKNLSGLIKEFLEDFSKKNIRNPVNYMDFSVVKKSGQNISVNVIFEMDPEFLPVPKIVKSDSLARKKWDELFKGSQAIFKKWQNSNPGNIEFFFSLISGKKNISIRHIPGVDVNDEFRVKTSVYEDNEKRVTTTTFYYETVTNPTFSSSLNQVQKFNEILYRLSPGTDGKGPWLSGIAVISCTNNKMNNLFESKPGLNNHSMLTKFISKKE